MGIVEMGTNVSGHAGMSPRVTGRVVDFNVVVRPVGRLRMHRDVELSCKIVPLPENPIQGIPKGCYGWMVMEYDPHDGHEAIVVGGVKPSAAEASAIAAEALQCEINQRTLPALITQNQVLDQISRRGL